MSANKKLFSRDEEENEVSSIKKKKWVVGPSSKGLTVARPPTCQSTISMGIMIKDNVPSILEVSTASVVQNVAPTPDLMKKKSLGSDNEVKFLGINSKEPVRKVFKALSP